MVVLVVRGSSFLSEVDDASDQEGAPHPVTSYLLLPPLPQITLPRSGCRGSDFVPWHYPDDLADAARRVRNRGSCRPAQRRRTHSENDTNLTSTRDDAIAVRTEGGTRDPTCMPRENGAIRARGGVP